VSSPSLPQDLVKVHLRNNRNSAGNWEDFAPHRGRMTAMLLDAAPATPGTLAILGAGNCNDVDLPALAARYREIHLVDVDTEAVTAARDRQPPAVAGAVVLHAPVDLSGALPRIPGFRAKPPTTPTQVEALAKSCVDNVRAALPDIYDTVVSACILSQIMHGARLAIGATPVLNNIADGLAAGHVRALAQLTRPGGTAILATDAVSSESYPLEELWGDRPPLDLLAELEHTDNVFSCTGPIYLRRLLARDPAVAPLVGPPRIIETWLWRLGAKITLMAYALVIKRRPQ